MTTIQGVGSTTKNENSGSASLCCVRFRLLIWHLFLNNFLHALLVHVLVQACGVWKPVECFLAGLRGRKRRGERCADLNFFAEFRSRSVSLNCCTCLLFIFEVRRRGGGR